MSERAIEERQGWASDIIGVGIGLGLYSVLFLLVTFLCILRSGLRPTPDWR
jgi:hypothetical protein